MALSASIPVYPTTPIGSFDFPNSDPALGRIVGVSFENLTLYLGLRGGDAEIVEAIDHLIEPLQGLRNAAMKRLAESDSPSPAVAEATVPA